MAVSIAAGQHSFLDFDLTLAVIHRMIEYRQAQLPSLGSDNLHDVISPRRGLREQIRGRSVIGAVQQFLRIYVRRSGGVSIDQPLQHGDLVLARYAPRSFARNAENSRIAICRHFDADRCTTP